MSVLQSMLSMMGSVASLAKIGEAPKVPGDVSTSAEVKQWTRQRTQAIKSAKQGILDKAALAVNENAKEYITPGDIRKEIMAKEAAKAKIAAEKGLYEEDYFNEENK